MANSIFVGAFGELVVYFIKLPVWGLTSPTGQGQRLGSALNFGDACGHVINLPQLPKRA